MKFRLIFFLGPPGPSSYRPPGPGGYPPPGPQGYPGYPGQQGPPMGQVCLILDYKKCIFKQNFIESSIINPVIFRLAYFENTPCRCRGIEPNNYANLPHRLGFTHDPLADSSADTDLKNQRCQTFVG